MATVFVNGIDGATGEYLVPPLERSELIERIASSHRPQPWLRGIADRATHSTLKLRFGLKEERLQDAGWAIVFHKNENREIREALAPLVEHRKEVVGSETIVKDLEYDGESRSQFLNKYGVAPPTVDPKRVPFYLLVIGSPSKIDFSFAQQMSVDYAVGQLDLSTPDDYRSYAESVIAYETAKCAARDKSVVVFGPRHDPATKLSADSLLRPIVDDTELARDGFTFAGVIGASAQKNVLQDIFLGRDRGKPALLFTASHGVGWALDHPQQEQLQGALLCADWPGAGPLTDQHYFAGRDIPRDANIHGLIAFHFACYSAGTPGIDRFPAYKDAPPRAIAKHPFVAALPKALLSHREGAALAVIGHVERAWGYSIETPDAGPQLMAFENFIAKVLAGLPVGFALRDFAEKYAVLSVEISSLLEQREFKKIDEDVLAMKWIERNDAEAYLLVGDPAVHLRTGDLNG